jgi:hypothetical protein
MKNKLKVSNNYGANIITKTSFDKDKIEVSSIFKVNDFEFKMFHKILNISEASIKTALIELGWTPPDETK